MKLKTLIARLETARNATLGRGTPAVVGELATGNDDPPHRFVIANLNRESLDVLCADRGGFDELELTGEFVTTVARDVEEREEIFEVHHWQPRYRQMILGPAAESASSRRPEAPEATPRSTTADR